MLSAEVMDDLVRLQIIWDRAGGPWLFGEFGAADIMFAPVATRLRTYGIALSGAGGVYCQRLLDHPLVAEWCELGEREPGTIPVLEMPLRKPED